MRGGHEVENPKGPFTYCTPKRVVARRRTATHVDVRYVNGPFASMFMRSRRMRTFRARSKVLRGEEWEGNISFQSTRSLESLVSKHSGIPGDVNDLALFKSDRRLSLPISHVSMHFLYPVLECRHYLITSSSI